MAGRTDVDLTGVRDEASADMAERRKNKIEGGCKKLLHGQFV